MFLAVNLNNTFTLNPSPPPRAFHLSTPFPNLTIMGSETTTFYDSPYMAELYELRWSLPDLPDMDVYWKAFTDLLSQHKQTAVNRPFTLLDIGTGTGRVVLGLLKRAAETSVDTGNTELIGLDNEQNMLNLAAKLESRTSGISPPVIWTLGTSLALDELPLLQQAGKDKTIDLALYPYGSICHLKGDGELEQFFSQVAKVLTPGTGQAYISFVDFHLERPGEDLKSKFNNDKDSIPQAEIPSVEYPGIWYRNEFLSSKYEGRLCVTGEKVQVVKRKDDGREEEIQNHSDEIRLRVFSEEEALGAIEAAGLRVVKVDKIGIDNIFVLQR